MRKSIVYVLLLTLIVSCTNTSINEDAGIDDLIQTRSLCKLTDWKPQNPTNILQFKDESEFKKMLEKLSDLDDEDSKESLVKAHFGEFYSLKNVYDAAMQIADELDESKDAYLKYKKMFDPYLYFSDYEDDCGAYLPVKNKDMAYLLNAFGEVCISGTNVCMNNVVLYDDLQDTGVAMYDKEENTMTRAWNSSYIDHSNIAFDESSGNVCKEYDSSWWEENKRKIRLKCGRKVVGSTLSPVMKLHIEISFRKKTWAGWANYSSKTTTTGTFTGGYNGSINFYKHADSSHDWYQTITTLPGGRDYLGFPHILNNAIHAELNLDFRGIGPILYLSFDVPSAEVIIPDRNAFL